MPSDLTPEQVLAAALQHEFLIYSDEEAGTDVDEDARSLLARLRRSGYTLVPTGELERLRAAVRYGPEGVTFPNLPHHPTGPDVLEAVAVWMDSVDDRDGSTNRDVQAHLRRWAAILRATLTEDETDR